MKIEVIKNSKIIMGVDTSVASEEEMLIIQEQFEAMHEKNETVQSINLEFVEGVSIEAMNEMFMDGDGSRIIKKQTITINN